MAARLLAVLVLVFISTTAILATPATIGIAYYHGSLKSHYASVPESGSVRIQSTSTASQAPPCNSDASCQALCPTQDITAQQPALSTMTVQQQVVFPALQHTAHLPV